MINNLEHSNRGKLRHLCERDLKKLSVLPDTYPLYEKGTFEYTWFDYEYNKFVSKEAAKSDDRHNFATKILKEIFNRSVEDLDKMSTVKFENPIQYINPFVFSIMKAVYTKDFDSLKDYKKLYRPREEYEPLEELLIMIDDLDTLRKVIGEKNIVHFLKEREDELNNNLKNHLEYTRSQRINLENDNIFTKYATILMNTEYHQKVFHRGQLGKNYTRTENVFGFTPCDYVINKLLYFFNTVLYKKDEIEKDLLILLTNLRNSVKNINREEDIVFIKKEDCISEEIEKMLAMV